MDYVTRQFINLTKKIRKELRVYLSKLDRTLDKLAEAIRQSAKNSKVENLPSQNIALHTNFPESVEVHQNAEDASHDRKYKDKSVALARLSLIALVFYATLVYLQLRTMIDATSATEHAVQEARLARQETEKSLNTAIEQFHLDQRAWIQIEATPLQFPKPPINPGALYAITGYLRIKNTGKTPASRVSGKIRVESVYETNEANLSLDVKQDIANVALPFLQPNDLSRIHIGEQLDGRKVFEISRYDTIIFGQLQYCDVFNRQHWIKFCLQYVPSDDANMVRYETCHKTAANWNGLDSVETQLSCRK